MYVFFIFLFFFFYFSCSLFFFFFFFFFQAEDGIRDLTVTGVQTCALPIFGVRAGDVVALSLGASDLSGARSIRALYALAYLGAVILPLYPDVPLSRRLELIARFGARRVITRAPDESTPDCPAIDPETFEWDFTGVGGVAAPRGDVPEWPFLFHFSGGTTGVPKALLFTHDRFLESLRRRARASGITPADRMMPSRPWPTLPGLRYMLRMHVIGGAFINIPCCETRDDLENVIRDT